MAFFLDYLRKSKPHFYDHTTDQDSDDGLCEEGNLLKEADESKRETKLMPSLQESWFTRLLVAKIAVTIVLLLLIAVGFTMARIHGTNSSKRNFPPPMELGTIKVFEQERIWWGPGFEADQMWNTLILNQKEGSVYISEADSIVYGLQAGLDSGNPDIYIYPVSMYHQLHCLGTIRKVFHTLNISEEVAFSWHLQHCFDFIRQGILCSSDLTLEHTGSGWGVSHLCKNPDEVATFLGGFSKEKYFQID